MTTDIQYEWTPDVFVDNAVFNLRLERPCADCKLSAAMISVAGSDHESGQRIAIEAITRDVFRSLPQYRSSLLLTKSYTKPAGKIALYQGLWKWIQSNKTRVPEGGCKGEYMLDEDNNVVFHSIIDLENHNFSEIVAFMKICAPYVVYHDERSGILNDISNSSWGVKGHLFNERIIQMLCESNVMVSALFGGFDDVDSGCVTLGRPELINMVTRDL